MIADRVPARRGTDMEIAHRLVIVLAIAMQGTGQEHRDALVRARGYVRDLALALGVEADW